MSSFSVKMFQTASMKSWVLVAYTTRYILLYWEKLGPHFLSQVRVRKKPIFTAATKPRMSGKNEAIFLIMKLGEKLVASIIAWISWSYYFVSKVNRYFVHSKKNISSLIFVYVLLFLSIIIFFLFLKFFLSKGVFNF